jgi:hypothetical protein
MDVLVIISAISAFLLTLIGILASIAPPQNKKERWIMVLFSFVFGIVTVVCLVIQSQRSNQQMQALEKALSTQYKQNEDRERFWKERMGEVGNQLSLVSDSPDIDLRKRALALSKEILQFEAERDAGKPENRRVLSDGDSMEQWEKRRELSKQYEQETRSLFTYKFGIRWRTIIKELKSKGIYTDEVPDTIEGVTFTMHGIDDYATRLGEIALHMPQEPAITPTPASPIKVPKTSPTAKPTPLNSYRNSVIK